MIDERLVQSICTTIHNGNRVNRLLPLGGKIVMDQLFPFICVYRFTGSPDMHFAQLVRTQASYIIVDDKVTIHGLLQCLASVASEKFKSFLIIELWFDQDPKSNEFHVHCPEDRAPATVKSLMKGFDELKKIYPVMDAKVLDIYQRHPSHLGPLLSLEESKELGSLLIGIQVPAIFREGITGNPYALMFRTFKRKFSEIIKKAVFEFIRVQTSKEFTHYLMLGKTHLDSLIRFADRQLADISERMNFLLRITPVNSIQEWERFKKNGFEKKPVFSYRLISLDPEIEKRRLYRIHIEKIEDPTLAFIFREKRMELEKQLTMLEERETRSFKFMGQSLYGEVGEETSVSADHLLSSLTEDTDEAEIMDCHQFAHYARQELDVYKKQFPDIDLQIKIRKDVTGAMVSKSHLLISTGFSIPVDRVEALIQHEIGTHILTYSNGRQQPLQQMYAGFAGYEQLQEGLAVLAEYLTNGLTAGRLRLLAARVRAVDCMINGADFIETFRILRGEYNFDSKSAFFISMRVFRGGGFVKDAIYLDGLIHLLKYLQAGGDLKILYSGKFHLRHVQVVKELMHRGILKTPFLSPYMRSEKVEKRIKKLKHVTELTQLLKKSTYDHSVYHQ